jgi:hypothetical protein
MFFRFGLVLFALVGLALLGLSIEKGNLALRRAISRQEYQRQQLHTERSRLRVEIERRSSPRELLERTPTGATASP